MSDEKSKVASWNVCGRVHMGPVEDKRVSTMRWQVCTHCGNKLGEDEQRIFWRIKKEAIACREKALIGAKTK